MQRKINFPGFYFLSEEIFFERFIYFLYIKKNITAGFIRQTRFFVRVISLFFDSSHTYYSLFHEKTAIPRVWRITVFLFLFYRTSGLREDRPYNRNYDNGYNHGHYNQTGSAFYVIHKRVFPGSQDEGVRRCAYRAGKCAGGSNENRHKYGSR